ncbi:hypothetical protein D3C81_1180430 [compost metagenome]
MPGQHQLALSGQRQVARLSGGNTTQRYPHAILGGSQHDLVGIHAAELGNVDAQGRCGSRARDRRSGQRGAVYLVGARDDVQMIGVQCRIGLHGAGDQVYLVDIGGIHAVALNGDVTTSHAEGVQAAAAAIDRHPGRERRAAGVDEAQAVHDQPVRVGNHHFGTRACDLHIALQLAGRCPGDIVDDDPGRAAGQQVGVAVDVARLLGGNQRRRVVQDDPGAGHIELRVGIGRDAGCRRARDVDLLQAVSCLPHRRAISASVGIRHHLSLCKRQAHRAPDSQHHGWHGESDDGGAGRNNSWHAAAAVAALAASRCAFRYCHQHAANSVEDKAIEILIHTRMRNTTDDARPPGRADAVWSLLQRWEISEAGARRTRPRPEPRRSRSHWCRSRSHCYPSQRYR